MEGQYITESVVRKGTIAIPVEEKEMLREAAAYNERMSINRAKMHTYSEIKKAYLLMSIVTNASILVVSDALNHREFIYFLILGLVLIFLVLWVSTRHNLFLILNIISSFGLIFWDKGFALSAVYKLAIGIVYLIKDEPLHREIAYPAFNNICIEIVFKDGHSTRLK